MKTSKTLFAVSLALAFSGAVAQSQLAHAELVKEVVKQDSIIPEGSDEVQLPSSDDEEVVVERRVVKKPATVYRRASSPRRMIIQEVQAQEEVAAAAPQAAPAAQVSVQSSTPVTVVPTAAAKQDTVGNAIDSAIDNKMNATKQKLADALVKAMDNIKISVGEESNTAPAAAPVAQVALAPTATTIVQDSVVHTVSAPATAAADANAYAALPADAEAQKSAADKKDADADDTIRGKIAVFPMAGYTSLSSNIYNINSRSSLGVGVEADIADGFSFMAGYMYSQYDVGLGLANPYVNLVSTTTSNMQSLQYNQNVIDAGLRYYLLPKNSRFQFFVGAGGGFNKGFLNYNQNTLNTFTNVANTAGLQDYEVTSFLGELEAGGDVRVSKSISVGANFKYFNVLSSNQNQQLNNNGFIVNGSTVNNSLLNSADKNVIGGSISGNNFYSILGNIKVRF